MRWAATALALAVSHSAQCQSVEDWLAQYRLATKNADMASRNETLRAMLDYRDPRINRVYCDALFDPPVANQAKWCLIRVGGAAFPEGWKKIESDPKAFTFNVLMVWAQCGPGGARELSKGLAHASPSVRQQTVRVFITHVLSGEKVAWLPLQDVQAGILKAYEDRDADTRRYVVQALHFLEQPERNALLLRAIKDEFPTVRELAAKLMYFCTDESRRAAMIAASSDPDPKVRAEVARNLDWDTWRYETLAMKVVPILVERLSDRDPGVRAAAMRSLCKWVDPRGTFGEQSRTPTPDEAATSKAVQALLVERRVADTAYLLLRDAAAKNDALRYLAYARDPRVFQRLLTECESDDYQTAWNAVMLLGLFGDSRAIPTLRKVAANTMYRQEAERAIKQIEGKN